MDKKWTMLIETKFANENVVVLWCKSNLNEMSGLLSFLFIVFCALNGMAQSPLLKTVEKPDATSPILRADGLLHSHWTQDYPYNQFCPRDPVNGNAYSVAGCPAIAMGQIINYLRTTEDTRFTDVLYIKGLPSETAAYSIFNVLGQKVAEGSSVGNISVAGWEKGLYFLQVKGENFGETTKFVVE